MLSKNSLKESRNILLSVTPDITEIIKDVVAFDKVHKKEDGLLEKFNIKDASASLHKLIHDNEATPERIDDALNDMLKNMLNTIISSHTTGESLEKFANMASEFLDMLLVRQYERVVRVLSVIFKMEESAIEEKSMFEISDMIISVLQDELLMRFFPQLRRLAQTMQ